jgi:trimethylamine--corrinoid protein Co-methyltransferase
MSAAAAGEAAGPSRIVVDVLAPEHVHSIHRGSLDVLERTGVFVEGEEAWDILSDGGCRVDRGSGIATLPPEVVEDALAACPRRVLLAGRTPAQDVWLEAGGPVRFTNFDQGVRYVDPHTGELRSPRKSDVADVARLVDALPEMVAYEAAIGPLDVPVETASIHGCEAALLNTLKPVGVEAVDRREVRACMALAAEVVGGADELAARPIIGVGVCPISPLKLTRDACEVIIEASRANLSDVILSMAMSGGSAPVTLAGTLVQHNAEVLAGLTLAQLTERGAPCVYGSSTTAMDLRLASATVGSPELALLSACAAQIARQYRLPSFIAGA